MNIKNSKYLACCILIFSAIIVIMFFITPLAFARDGLLTKQYVKSYDDLYDINSLDRHDGKIEYIYLLYFGSKKITVENSQGKNKKLEKVSPFLYRWTTDDYAYRLTIGKLKYYVMFITN